MKENWGEIPQKDFRYDDPKHKPARPEDIAREREKCDGETKSILEKLEAVQKLATTETDRYKKRDILRDAIRDLHRGFRIAD